MKTATNIDRRLCVAPMMDWTDRHCRYFHRLLAPTALLYTEMVTTGAILHGDRDRLIGYSEEEHPLALQLGGSDPEDLARCARIAQQRGYDEVNLNVGCPSDRVQKGRFGACLMLEPALVSQCLSAMQDSVDIPITVKTRLGVDDHDSYAWFSDFIGQVAQSRCRTFIIHARKAWLSGLSPKQNREVPDLMYDRVYRLKQERPELEIILNGGIATQSDVETHLERLDGVMLGRAAYQTPWVLRQITKSLQGIDSSSTINDEKERDEVIDSMTAYLTRQAELDVPVKHISRHVLGLFQGLPGARRWRRFISENAHLDPSNTRLLLQAKVFMAGVHVKESTEPGSRVA
jgi:tRNA-dihydrouridine synthase A